MPCHELVSGGRSLIPAGPPGIGKTALRVALTYKAIQHGAEACFTAARKHGYWEGTLAGYLDAAEHRR